MAKRKPNSAKLLAWLDVVAIASWGILLLKYWVTEKLFLLIHPNFFSLVVGGGIGLIIVSGAKARQLLKRRRVFTPDVQHMTIFPPGLGSMLLLIAAILGILITPSVFASDKALQRGGGDLLATSRLEPQAFRASVRPEERSLIDWVRTLNVYPEPDSYKGQLVKVTGFVIHPPELDSQYLLLSRFVLGCCAADAYPIGLPVKLKTGAPQQFPADTWLEVEGKMTTETISNKRQLTIVADSLKKIPQPKNPYSY